MKHFFRIVVVLTALLIPCAARNALAQAGSIIPIPIVTTYAGLPTGSGNTICSQSIPQLSGASLGDGCPATQAAITTLYDVEVDAEGNVYTGEQASNYDLRMVYKGGTTVAALILATNPQNASLIGTPVPGDVYTIGGGLTATLTKTSGIYYCGNKVGGVQALNQIGDGCPASEAFLKPKGMAIDPYGDIIMVNTELYDSVRVIYAGGPQMAKLITLENPSVTTPQFGYIYELAGTGAAGTEGDGGLAISAGFIAPRYIALDSALNIYVTDGTTNVSGSTTIDNSGNNIREINIATGIITTYAGENYCETQPGGYSAATGCPNGFSGDGGPATSALLHSPYAIFFDHNDNLFITDDYNARVRVVYRGGTLFGISNPVVGDIYTYIGGGTIYGTDGTPANQVAFGSASSAATINTGGIDKAGNVYVLDGVVHNLWRFDSVTGIGYIIADGGITSSTAPQKGAYCSGGTTGPVSTDAYGDGCPAIQADIAGLGTLSFDSSGNFYFATSNSELEKFSYNNNFGSSADGTTVTQALAFKDVVATSLNGESFELQGGTTSEFGDGGGDTCTQTQVLALKAVCVFKVTFDPAHDGLRPGLLQLSTPSGVAVTENLYGTGIASDIAIDTGTSSTIGTGLSPSGVGTDLLGNVYVADANTGHLLKGPATGTTLTSLFGGLNSPSSVAVDNAGDIFVADTGNNRIFEASSAGATIASLGSGLSGPKGVAIDGLGYAIVADTGNNRIVRIAPNGYQLTIPFVGITPALSSPTAVQVDSSGDIYVLDSGNQRVLEYNASTGTISPITLDSGVVPINISVDLAGDVYVVNSAANNVLVYSVGATSGNILLSGLKSPAGIAVDADANLFVADTSQTGALELRRSLGNIAFPLTNLNTTTNASISISDVGNASLNFPAAPMFTISGSNSNLFSIAPAASNGCAVGTVYLPGAGCNFTATFAPMANVNASATAVFNTNALDTTTAKALLTGVGKLLVPTTVAVTISPATVYYAQSAGVIVTVTPSTTTTTPSGTFTLVIDGKTQPPVSIGSGSYTVSLNLTVGTHTITATYSGDTTYASSTSTDTFTVNPAVTSTSITVAPVNNNGSISLLFTSVVSATTASGQTGTVTFYAGMTAISPAIAINAANSYTATYSTTTLSFASPALTAVYSGSSNGNFAPSTSPVFQTSGGDFAVGSAAQSFSIPQGGIAQLGITLAPLFGGAGTITATCSGLPQNSVCRFNPDNLVLNGGTPLNVFVQVYTNVSSTLASNQTRPSNLGIVFAFGLPLGLGLLLSRRRQFRLLAVLMLGLVLTAATSGCGNGTVLQTFSNMVTPAGTYPLTITFVGSNGLTETHSATATFTVLTNP